MTPEQKARLSIDKKLEQSGWTVQDLKQLNPMASLGIAREVSPYVSFRRIQGRSIMRFL